MIRVASRIAFILMVAVLGVLVLVWLASLAGASEPRGYEDVRASCSADAFRLCSWSSLRAANNGRFGPILACARANQSQLSGPCHETLHRYGYL